MDTRAASSQVIGMGCPGATEGLSGSLVHPVGGERDHVARADICDADGVDRLATSGDRDVGKPARRLAAATAKVRYSWPPPR